MLLVVYFQPLYTIKEHATTTSEAKNSDRRYDDVEAFSYDDRVHDYGVVKGQVTKSTPEFFLLANRRTRSIT